MKVVILAGGLGTRLSEETYLKPKPMVEIGSEPILWHIMKIYSTHGFNNFIVCAGYKQNMIKDYFVSYLRNHIDVEVNFRSNDVKILNDESAIRLADDPELTSRDEFTPRYFEN